MIHVHIIAIIAPLEFLSSHRCILFYDFPIIVALLRHVYKKKTDLVSNIAKQNRPLFRKTYSYGLENN
ncbi:hypothetical protein PUN28_001984 [Cardiocondyla obscurior]|uniref:Uncharacterized protein n=1 Tax=Cardiocondyla obscurior TaxID=286306 RepID=A0AAW2GRZ1_9HYME